MSVSCNSFRELILALGVASLALTFASSAHAEAIDPSAPRLQRRIQVTKAGPQILAVDLELLAGTQSSLADLRLFDEASREVMYLLVPPRTQEPTWHASSAILPTVSGKGESGFEIDLGESLPIDRLRLSGLATPWMKRLRVEASGDHRRYNLLVPDGTLFDLPDEGLRQVELDFAPGEYRHVRVVWDDRSSSAIGLPETVSVRLTGSKKVPVSWFTSVPWLTSVPFESRHSRAPLSQWRIRLPGKGLPIIAVEVETKQAPLSRTVRVSESRLEGGRLESRGLGTATLRRTLRSGLVAADLRIPIEHPEGNELILTVDDGNNAPLVIERVLVALDRQPSLYFEARQPGTFVMHYGKQNAEAPRYDLEAERENVTEREIARAEWAGPAEVLDRATPSPPNPQSNVVWAHGSAVDKSRFAYSRAIEGNAAGMLSVRLDPAVLAHSTDLGDLRILDVALRQVPYLVERESEPLIVDLLAQPTTNDSRPKALDARFSIYQVQLPFPTLPSGRLVLTTNHRVFRRELSVYVERPAHREKAPSLHEVVRATWVHADPNQTAVPIELVLPAGTDPHLLLAIDDGDNDRLPLASARLYLPAHSLRCFRQRDETLQLFYGDPSLVAPSYDLALLAGELRELPTNEASLEPEVASARVAAKPNSLTKWFWGVLVLTVLSLIGLIVRLVRKGEPSTPESQ